MRAISRTRHGNGDEAVDDKDKDKDADADQVRRRERGERSQECTDSVSHWWCGQHPFICCC